MCGPDAMKSLGGMGSGLSGPAGMGAAANPPMAPQDGGRFWSPGHEQQFQTFMAFDPRVRDWRNSFARKYGEPPQIDGGDFSYRKAFLAGDTPMAVPGDTVPHWPSTGKSVDHPTAWKQQFVDRFGVDPDQAVASGRTTPEMVGAINDQVRLVGRDSLIAPMFVSGAR